MDLNTKKARVRYLAESVTDIPRDPDRGRMLLILLYWKVFEGIDIPETLMKQLMLKGSNPETLGRLARFVNTDIAKEKLEEMRNRHED
jgi:hypothetical protein